MKNIYLALLLLFSFNLLSQSITYTDKRGNPHLLGTIERQEIQSSPFSEWYDFVYEKYETDKSILKKIDEHYDDDIQIKIYLGTWCGDSKREVTRFLKIADETKIKEKNIELIGLDNRPGKTKQGPAHEEKGLNIHRVPTFIFYKDNEEIARIVESPVSGLEKDVAQIYAGLAPTPNYKLANLVLDYFDEMGPLGADTTFAKKIRYLKRMSKNEGELNTLGYVLLSADEKEKAIVALKLNTLLYPEAANTFDSLGEAYMKNGDKQLAIENYLKAYQMDNENLNAISTVIKLVGSDNDG